MANEVRIKVKVIQDDADLSKVKADVLKTASDIEGELGKSGQRSGGKFGEGFEDEVSKSLTKGVGSASQSVASEAGSFWMPLAITAGTVFAPLLGGIIGGAIVGGAGIGGVLGGILLVKNDPRVKSAAADMGKNFSDSLHVDAKPFVQPVLNGIATLEIGFQRLEPTIKSIFAKSAAFVQPLTDGIVGMVSGIARGINALVTTGGPTIAAFGDLFSSLGSAVGDAFTKISSDSKDTASSIEQLSKILNFTVEVFGDMIHTLTQVSGWMTRVGDEINSQVDSTLHLNDGTKKLSGTTQGFVPHVAGMTGALSASTLAANKTTTAFQDLADQIQSQTDPLYAYVKGSKAVTDAQDALTKAIGKFGPKSDEAKQALADLSQAAFRLPGLANGAAASFDGKLTPAMETVLKKAGLTGKQIRDLSGYLQDEAKSAKNWGGVFTQTFKTIYSTTGRETLDSSGHRTGGYMAHGGVVGAAASGGGRNGRTWVGERGPELLDLPSGSTVHTAGDSARMAAQGNGNGGSPIMVQLVLDGAVLVQKLVNPLRGAVLAGGGNVQTYLGQPGR